MKVKAIISVVVAMLCGISSFAQLTATEQCAAHKRGLAAAAKTTVRDASEEDYDIKHVKIDVALSNESVSIAGNVTVHAIVKAPQMSTYSFELDDTLAIDSVIFNGANLPVVHHNNVGSVSVAPFLPNGAAFTAVIYYHGLAQEGNGYFQTGINRATADVWGAKTVYTLSEPYMGYMWWPCKQSLQDKIDSADIWVTVPEGTKAGSNGLLKKITPLANNFSRYEWHTNYPVDYYLLSISVAPYVDYSYRITIPGSNDSLLVQNYVYNTPGALAAYKAGIDSTADMLQYFSQLFGPYPFIKEKYGHCIVPLPGGMEHQTMTSCGDFGPILVSHELAHQWFGDHVTCATWRDIWLNEGFASYAEYLFLQHFRPAEAAAHMQLFHDNVLKNTEKRGAIYVDDTASDDRIFDSRLSYSKPAAVLHTLRYIANNDSLFFLLLKKYQQQYAFGNATTENFKTLAAQTLQIDLDTFFNEWIYGQGYPIYGISWNQVGDDLFIQFTQTTSVPASVALYHVPVELKLQSADASGIYRVSNSAGEQVIRLKYEKKITAIIADPNNYILNGDAGQYRDPELGINELTSNEVKVWPNGATDYWSVIGLEPNTGWLLTDINGKTLQKGNTGTQTSKVIYTDGLVTGMYFLSLYQGRQEVKTIKLIKD